MAAMPGPACCTELGHSTHLLCGSSPCQRQPFCASPRLCPSQPPEVLALSVPTGARAWYRTCLPPPHTCPSVHSPVLRECELLSHLPGSSDKTPARTWSTCTAPRGWSLQT